MHAFDVLGDPVRRRILELLAGGEHASGEIVEAVQREFAITQSAVSQHLKVLRDSGFASVRVDGARRQYALKPEPLSEVDAWLDRFRGFWTPKLEALATEVARGKRGRSASPPMALVRPAREHLESYAAALKAGWSPDNLRPAVAGEQLERIAADAEAFLAGLYDPKAEAGPVTLPDGTTVQRLPGFHMWMWDGAFCGSIGFRWRPGTTDLPAHVLGHVGYAVVPWKEGRGYATRALGLVLPLCRAEGLAFIDLTCDPANVASQKVILNNGGQLVERFEKSAAYGGGESLRYRIDL